MKTIEMFGDKGTALVDDGDYYALSRYKWHITSNGYAGTNVKINGKWTIMLMHRLIMGQPDCDVDHINGQKLDNRRENLRTVSRSQNMHNSTIGKRTDNTSGVPGVCFNKRRGKWIAYCYFNGKSYHLGYHETLESARKAREEGEKSLMELHKYKE